jgi:hypothetical protein
MTQGLRLNFDVSWKRKLDDPINCLAVGKPFLEELNEENDILIGTSSGRILICWYLYTSAGRYGVGYKKRFYTIDCVV